MEQRRAVVLWWKEGGVSGLSLGYLDVWRRCGEDYANIRGRWCSM